MNEATSRPDSEGVLRAVIVERPGAAVAAILFGLIAIAAMLAPLIAPTNPFDLASLDVLDAELPPRWVQGSDPSFLLGTDAQGRDLLSGIALALFRAALGGESLSRYAVPLLVVVIGLAEWPYFARTARAATQVEAAKDYVRAARALGASDLGIVGRHILPNILSPLIVVATTQIAGAIMAEAALSFLGLGMPVTKPSLGTLIRSGYDLMFAGAWWITVIPGIVLIGLLVSVNVLGDTLRDALDPRLSPR